MDMSRFSEVTKAKDGRLRQHTDAIRENQISVALMMLYLQGYEIKLEYTGTINASAALECLEELEFETQTAIWSCSTTAGGIWEPWQRACLKTGQVPDGVEL